MIKISEKHLHKPLVLFKLIPNLLTLMSLTIGLNSLKMALDGNWERSVVCIIIAAVIDGLDGRLARFLNATSVFGAQLDSLCDFANFGIFPVFIIYLWLLPILHSSLLWNATVIYSICMVIRLARFNSNLSTHTDNIHKMFFVGVPAPIGAVLVLMPLILSFEVSSSLSLASYGVAISFYIVAIGLLLASKLPTFSLKYVPIPKERVWIVMLGFTIFIMELLLYPWYVVPITLAVYCISIIFSVRYTTRIKKRQPIVISKNKELEVEGKD